MAQGGFRQGAGRKVGSKATHTVQAEAAKAELIRMYMENVQPINQALIDKAKTGDTQAIRELHDRVWGKAAQDIKLSGEITSKIISIDE